MGEARIVVLNRDFAFQNRLESYSFVNNGYRNLDEFLNDAFHQFVGKVRAALQQHHIIKVSTCFVSNFSKTVTSTNSLAENDEEEQVAESQSVYMHSTTKVIDSENQLDSYFNNYVTLDVKSRIEDIELRGSGFTLSSIVELNVQISRYNSLAGSSYMELPKCLKSKQAIINVKNTDQMCFKYAILSCLYPPKHDAQRVIKYRKYSDKLNFAGIDFPVTLKDITKFENQNTAYAINVYMYEEDGGEIRPIRLSSEVKGRKTIHLLMLKEEIQGVRDDVDDADEVRFKTHYCWIKNLSRLLSLQSSKNNRKKLFCDRCLNYFNLQSRLDAHIEECVDRNSCQIEMPEKPTNKIRFDQFKRNLTVPFIIYADIEALLLEPTQQFSRSERTVAYQQHEAFSIGMYFKSEYGEPESYYKSFRGPDCIDSFVRELRSISNRVDIVLNRTSIPKLTKMEEMQFQLSSHCHICGMKYGENDKRVRDHSHLTGEYRGSAHSDCNLQYQETRYVPVVFHNLSHYDSHFIIQKLLSFCDGPVSAIPKNEELYISFSKVFASNNRLKFHDFIKFRFIDSFRFLPASLDYLVSLVPSVKKKILHSNFKHALDRVHLLEKKGVFCYDYMNSWARLDDTKLPVKDQFFSRLSDSHISDDEYEHAELVWNAFNIQTLGEYSDLYMKTDILLLADVFEQFRQTCHSIYGLDPAHYFTSPGLSFDAMLKMTNIEIELLTDSDMLMFVEKGVRGGISQCSTRYATANNKYMPNYDPNNESNYLMYLDANNLYGYSMSKYLPLNNFKWCKYEWNANLIKQIPDNSCDGYIFEVDLEYPQELHDKHRDYPMCAEKRCAPTMMVVANDDADSERKKKSKHEKLMLTLDDKDKYIIHYTMLKLALQQGIRIRKIHRVLQFEQSAWLKPYIELNTRMRTLADNDADKNFFKLMNNSCFGKTMENLRSRVEIKFVKKWGGRYGARKLIAKPNFKRWTKICEDMIAIHLSPTKIVMNKPITIGMSILDISKVLMYDFYYNFLQPQYGENVRMLYTDTDSFILDVKTDCFYEDMKMNIRAFDTSDYPENNIYNMPRENKKVPGLFKDEMNGVAMTEFVGLRSKMYAVKCGCITKMKKAKGVKKYVLKNQITFNDYKNCIDKNTIVIKSQNTIRSKKHTLFSIRQEKIALSPFDDKRFICSNGVDTLPWGHYSINM